MIRSRERLKILYLDDSLANSELIERQLRSAGLPFTLQRAAARDAFIRALEEFRPDVVLAGGLLPDFGGHFDGFSAVRLVREKDADLPVILVDSVLSDEAAISAIEAGASDCVLKNGLARLALAVERAVVGAEQSRICRRREAALQLSEQRCRSLIVAIAEIVSTREEAASDLAHEAAQDSPDETECRLRRRDGEYRCFSIRAAPPRATNSAVGEWIGRNIDSTDRQQRDEELRRLHAKAAAALGHLERQGREMQILKNLGDTLQACNSREEAYPFIAMAATELFSGSSGALAVPAAGARELLETAIEWGENLRMKADFASEDCWGLRRGGMHEPGAGTACHHFKSEPIKIESGGPYACVPLAVRGEVSGLLSIRLAETQRLDEERRSAISTFGNAVALGLSTLQLRETLQEQSIRDPLTGLARSQFSHAVLAREIRRAERHRESLSLALLDLNGFSQVKEAYGPQAVDGLLHEVETLLWSTLGPFDLAARCESQQFLVILVGDDLDNHYLDNREAARPMPRLRRICLEIQQKTDTYQSVALPQVTVSAGLAEWPVHGTTAEELMRSANQALRAARLAGPGCIERYSKIGMPPAGDARGPLDGDRSPTGNLLP